MGLLDTMAFDDKILSIREASHVERCHTIRHIGSYTNGQHSFDMLTLALNLKPEVSKNLMLAIIHHDLPERWTGDVPFSTKMQSHDLHVEMIKLEEKIKNHFDWNFTLTPEELEWLLALDRLEFYMWTQDQLLLGNRNVEGISQACRTGLMVDSPEPIKEYVTWVTNYRTSDNIPG